MISVWRQVQGREGYDSQTLIVLHSGELYISIHNIDHYNTPTQRRYRKSRKKVAMGGNHGDNTPHPLSSQNNCFGGISSRNHPIGAVNFHFNHEVTDGPLSPDGWLSCACRAHGVHNVDASTPAHNREMIFSHFSLLIFSRVYPPSPPPVSLSLIWHCLHFFLFIYVPLHLRRSEASMFLV